MKRALLVLVLGLAGLALRAPLASAAALSTAFTYQGSLDHAGVPTSVTCAFSFKLFDALNGGNQIGGTLTPAVTLMENGQFSVPLDFGVGVFDGNQRWLEIAVQCPGDPSFSTLAPRQSITATPYALYALTGPGAGGGFVLPFAGAVTSPSQDALRIQNNAASTTVSAIHGISAATTTGGTGAVFGEATGTSGATLGVYGLATASPTGTGVVGKAGATGAYFESFSTTIGPDYAGVYGVANAHPGVKGISTLDAGVLGSGYIGVWGHGSNSSGVYGESAPGFPGVHGVGTTGDGTWGISSSGHGVFGQTSSAAKAGGYFTNTAGGPALIANGTAQVKTLQILGADLAESFPVRAEGVEPGTVLALTGDEQGTLAVCDAPYSPRVAGVASGANGLPAGVVLEGREFERAGKVAVAMSGRVWVKCDATSGAIGVGDLLTSAPRAGHAMRAADPARATGAILGKAMTSLAHGTGLVLVLVSLQ